LIFDQVLLSVISAAKQAVLKKCKSIHFKQTPHKLKMQGLA